VGNPTKCTGWPAHLEPGAVRFGRVSEHYEETVAFYRDLVGLPVVDRFADSFGEEGTIFGLPDTTVQLEVVRARDNGPRPPTFDQLVLYLRDAAAVARATERLRAARRSPASSHPYWAANGAPSYLDPDGREVVYAPWVFGRDVDPVDRPPGGVPPEPGIEWYDGDRQALRALFEEAEDSRAELDTYIDTGRVLAAWVGDDVVGHLQLTAPGPDGEIELKNMAVQAEYRGAGIGRALVRQALRLSAAAGARCLLVATAAADVGNLGFYQRCGFRFLRVERDAFTPASGYPEPIVIDGIPLLDRVWLSQDC
jgi:ribosomal protein S18 acetylase RimI-like enzyme